MVGIFRASTLILALPLLVQASPLSSYDAHLAKRKLYNLDNISNSDHKALLTQGLKDAVTMVKVVLSVKGMNSDKHKSKLERWFGSTNSDQAGRDKIEKVFKNFYGTNSDGTGADILGDVFVREADYWTPDDTKMLPNPDNKKFCDIVINGKSGTAYLRAWVDDKDGNKKKPGMHYCDKTFKEKTKKLSDIVANGCSSLNSVVSTPSWGKPWFGFAVLHEYMHYNPVGKSGAGATIKDYAYGADNCINLANGGNKANTIINADTYAYFAMHIYAEETCGKSFSYPRDDRDNDPTQADWPDSDPEFDDAPATTRKPTGTATPTPRPSTKSSSRPPTGTTTPTPRPSTKSSSRPPTGSATPTPRPST